MEEDIYWLAIIIVFIIFVIILGVQVKGNEFYIKQLEQNNIEQSEEKEVYINKCKMLEDLIKENGITLDECECG